MAYNLDKRFPRPPTKFRLLEPGSYQHEYSTAKRNKAPFLSTTPRNTQFGNPLWTHAIYDADSKGRIQNCTSLLSKKPRFPYEALSKEDIESILCRCGIQNVCECSDEAPPVPEIICQAKTQKKLYKGPTPKSGTEGLSSPSRRDNGFKKQIDGSYKRMFKVDNTLGPPFYNTEVVEATAYYRGWKWGQWRSSRATKAQEKRPGPADYTISRPPTREAICNEKIREQKRKYSKQLRYIEIIQDRNIKEQRPGPADYDVKEPKGTDIACLGPKADRFQDTFDIDGPGPAAHLIRRDFDLPEPPNYLSRAKLPEPSCFGVKAKRFKELKEEGPSAASYDPRTKLCNFLNCSTAPFGTSAIRFKPLVFKDDNDYLESDCEDATYKVCTKPTWEFKSKTIRMRSLQKKPFEQSPADVPMKNFVTVRQRRLQKISPFLSSEGRFQPWYDWLPVYARLNTPGPGYYNLEKYKCWPAFQRGPLYRAKRFSTHYVQSPAPNEYAVGGGVETVLATHNKRLKCNIRKQHKFEWKIHEEPIPLTLEEKETKILEKAIAGLAVEGETEIFKAPNIKQNSYVEHIPDTCECKLPEPVKPKLLRYFLYSHPVKMTF